ncbi:MAG TPA: hypothetical protein VF691_04735 [Cytophagaceae bacterium]|jgi:hypothetical protein
MNGWYLTSHFCYLEMVKENKLTSILSEGYKISIKEIAYITFEDLRGINVEEEILNIYKSLGGIQSLPNLPFLQEHIIIEPNILLILDDERKFNRYRASTLKATVYSQIKHFPLEKYKSFCRTYENQCLKSASHAAAWTNREAEKSYGKAAEFGDLDANGSPLWKEIAMHDFILDHLPLISDYQLLRISVWDNILINSKMYKVSDLLLTSRPDLNKALYKFLDRKIAAMLPPPVQDNSSSNLLPVI